MNRIHRFSFAGQLFVVVLLITLAIPQVSEAAGFLKTQGHNMIDESGKIVLLRGVGLGNWYLPEGYMWKFGDQGDRPRKIEALVAEMIGTESAGKFWPAFRRNYITEADIRRIAELGYNSVRPALNARLFLTEGDNPVDVAEGYELLDNLVGWCRKHKIYVIIDMHGAPGGQTGTNIDDSPRDQAELFADPKFQDRLEGLWVKIADRYKNEPTVAGYDLLNEPMPKRTGAFDKYKDRLEPLYRRLTKAIRAVDQRHMITLEGADWANEWSVFTEKFDDNLFYQFHFYCWDRPDKLNGIDQYLKRRNELNAPVWVGETGEKNNAIYWGTMQLFETNNIGWSFWPWKKMDANNGIYSIKRPSGWDGVVAFSRGQTKPAKEVAQKAFDELLDNVKLENCVFYPDVVNAMFRRAPAKVEAENYGHEGAGKSYSLKDTSQKSKFYRTSEPVPVEMSSAGGNRFRSEQSVRLQADEWTAYTIYSLSAKDYKAVARVKAIGEPAEFLFSIGQQKKTLPVSGAEWTELDLGSVKLVEGANCYEVKITKGTIQIDWIRFE